MENKTRQRLISHYKKYPEFQIQDLFKYLYQSAFGCEHMLASEDKVIDFICDEQKARRSYAMDNELVEELDGEYSRVGIDYLEKGLSPKTFGRIFCASAKKETDGRKRLEEKLEVLRELVCEKIIAVPFDEFEEALLTWRENGYGSLSHSALFKARYNPSYRVIANEYVRILPALAKIDNLLQHGSAIVAIEGGSGSGKTTLAALLCKLYEATIFHIDDFFLRPEQRMRERYSEIGGNVDWERFLEEVLIPLSNGERVRYRRFDCSTMSLTEIETVVPKRLVVVEGVYSMHSKLAGYYDMSIFLDISSENQRKRIEKRNLPHIAKRFFEEWIPLENRYFDMSGVRDRCEIVISND